MSTSTVFLADVAARGIPPPTPEYRFHGERRWRFDYAWPQYKVALEVEGGVFGFKDPKTGKHRTGGAHSSITGIKRDLEKYSIAAIMGWCVIRVLPTELISWNTLEMVKEALTRRGAALDAAGKGQTRQPGATSVLRQSPEDCEPPIRKNIGAHNEVGS